MSFVSSPGSGSSMPGNVATGGSAAAQAAGIRYWRPHAEVRANGALLPHVLSGTIVHGLDLPYATATIELASDPGIANNAEIDVITGAGLNNVGRFRGLYKRRRMPIWPHSFTLLARGRYSLAHAHQQASGMTIPTFVNQRLPVTGVPLVTLLDGATPTDQNIVLAVLNRVPGLTVDPADIGGTGKLFGRLAWRDLAWTPFQTAGAYIQNLDRVCLGYRTFESFNGRIMRTVVRGYPTGSSDVEYTEGIDIWDATGENSIEDLINTVYVEGYPVGGLPGIINAYVPSSNDVQGTTPHAEVFRSPLIEGIVAGDPGDAEYPLQSSGLTPRDVALWRMDEGNRALASVDLLTFRDDILFPGRTIAVNAPHTGVTQPVWMQRVEIRFAAEPTFWVQRVLGFGGGLPGDYTPPNPY